MVAIAAAGNHSNHGYTTICVLASVTSVPHDASGARTPTPRKLSSASTSMTCGSATLA